MRASISKKFKEMPISDTEPVGPIKHKDSGDDVPKTIGDVFHAVRSQKNLDIVVVAELLNISPRFLKAIEAMDIAHLPEKVYTLGFVRSYAKHLGVDPQKSVDEFRTKFYGEKLPLFTREMSYARETNLPSKKVLIASALAIFIISLAWIIYKSSRQETFIDNQTPSQQTELQRPLSDLKPVIPLQQSPMSTASKIDEAPLSKPAKVKAPVQRDSQPPVIISPLQKPMIVSPQGIIQQGSGPVDGASTSASLPGSHLPKIDIPPVPQFDNQELPFDAPAPADKVINFQQN